MFNIFQQPWTLITVALVSMIVVFVYRAVFPQKQKPWQLLIPLVIAILALSLDFFVKTDYEKVNALMKNALLSVTDQTTDLYQQILSDNYSDSAGRTKTELLAYRQAMLQNEIVTSCKKVSMLVTPPKSKKASAVITATIGLNKSMNPELDALQKILVKAKAFLQKEPDNKWRIYKTQIVEVNNQPVSWNDIK